MIDFSDCPCEGGTLDRLIQPAILVVLTAGPVHGYRLAQQINEMPGFISQKPDASGVYRTLKLMECKGLVHATWDTSSGGPAKKLYQLTSDGKDCLRHWVRTLEHYRRGIGTLLRAARSADRGAPRGARLSRGSCCD